ncbi:unnamed protein product [Adineta steineri]|uniref:Methyltransferase FkbM domain-containing protein n=1 Tax=Adineta steineri TaxID=433720 RepID=A0A819ZH96_9BILA|nr:unnamed protein product [Adineta steineri]CAF4170937.1 unnamed protein product [Adineta steineri]
MPANVFNTCIKAKPLLNYVNTHICLHEANADIFVSAEFRKNNSVWEESHIEQILRHLLRHPHLDFIDLGANIGTYTLYVAALGRFVVAVECFAPNVARLHRAIELANVANRVVLVQNAIFTRSGEVLRLSSSKENIAAQRFTFLEKRTSTVQGISNFSANDPLLVHTITFDELLPIFIARGVRAALLKLDIEGSESFVLQSGSQIFQFLEIPFVQMEWASHDLSVDRVSLILNFFLRRNYEPTTCTCKLLDVAKYPTWPFEICWIKKNSLQFC